MGEALRRSQILLLTISMGCGQSYYVILTEHVMDTDEYVWEPGENDRVWKSV
jgi:hypothetical protein